MKNGLNPDPLWRVTLYWGTVISFFTLPLLVMTIQFTLIAYPEILHGNASAHVNEFKYVFEFQRTLAALIFGLAGLHTGEVIVAARRATNNEKPPSQPPL